MLVSRDAQAKIEVLTGLQGRGLQKQWKQLWNPLEFSWKKCREEETIVLTKRFSQPKAITEKRQLQQTLWPETKNRCLRTVVEMTTL